MRCKYCGYDVNPLNSDRQGVCTICAGICNGLEKRTITSATVARILKDIRPEEGWVATWGKSTAA